MNANRQPRVSIIGAGRVGSTLAQRILERDLADVVLLDLIEGWPQGVALDLNQARPIEGHSRQIVGTNDYADTADSDIVVITAGKPRLPGRWSSGGPHGASREPGPGVEGVETSSGRSRG